MNDERQLLLRLIEGPVSGDVLARESGQTRAAVWKRIQGLRDAGVAIEARPGRGYRLAVPVDLLDAAALRASLPPAVAARLDGPDLAWSIDSTNSELLRRPLPPPGITTALLAERQTRGRGRRGRPWVSPLAAHLYLSLARCFEGGLARLGGLSLVAGVAAAEALHALGFTRVRLKWPNDLVVDMDGGLHKLGGFLVEGGGEHAGPVRAVLGLGLNVRMPAAQASTLDQPWCDLAGLAGGDPVDRNRVGALLLARLVPALEQFDAEGLAPFLPRHAALDVLADRAVRLHGADGRVRDAVARGLAGDGALRVELAGGGEEHVHSGEVSVRRLGVPA